jgi:hypothetical protein
MRDGMTELEAAARAINAEPWEPPPGMTKRQCQRCRYFFAAPIADKGALCPDCAAERGERSDLPSGNA